MLHDVNFTVHKGDVVAMLGANGAGKTTLVKHALGLLKPTAGRVLLEGRDTRDMSVAQAARTAGWMALLGAPIMAVLFVLFPRLAPLWGMDGHDRQRGTAAGGLAYAAPLVDQGEPLAPEREPGQLVPADRVLSVVGA